MYIVTRLFLRVLNYTLRSQSIARNVDKVTFKNKKIISYLNERPSRWRGKYRKYSCVQYDMLELFQVEVHADGSKEGDNASDSWLSHKTKDLSSDGQNACQIM